MADLWPVFVAPLIIGVLVLVIEYWVIQPMREKNKPADTASSNNAQSPKKRRDELISALTDLQLVIILLGTITVTLIGFFKLIIGGLSSP